MMAEFKSSRPATSALYAIASSAFYFLGPATGSASDRLGPRALTAFGALVMGGGLLATAFVTDLAVAYLTYGLGVGLGAACAYVPTFAVIGGWFDRWRTQALSIAAAGTGIGMLALPPLCAVIIEHYGWRAAVLVLAVISATVLAACAALVRPVPPHASPAASEPLGRMLRSRAFLQIYTSWVFGTIALFVPLVFLPAFAVARGADPVAASWLISIIGGASVLGRLGIGYVARFSGSLLLYKGSILAMAASYVLWLLVPDYGGLLVFAAVLGVAYGVRIALVAPVLIELFGARRLGGLPERIPRLLPGRRRLPAGAPVLGRGGGAVPQVVRCRRPPVLCQPRPYPGTTRPRCRGRAALRARVRRERVDRLPEPRPAAVRRRARRRVGGAVPPRLRRRRSRRLPRPRRHPRPARP
jgi:MFS family permease